MRIFDHFPNAMKCPICGTNEDKQCTLVAIEGTHKDGIVEAQPLHTDCIELTYYNGTIGQGISALAMWFKTQQKDQIQDNRRGRSAHANDIKSFGPDKKYPSCTAPRGEYCKKHKVRHRLRYEEKYKHTCKNPGGDDECFACGVRDCPSGEPLHYHHDGCPACIFNEEKRRVKE